MWTCPKLQELNVSLNLLKSLPSMRADDHVMDASAAFESLPYIPIYNPAQAQILSPLSPEGPAPPLPSSALSTRDLILQDRNSKGQGHGQGQGQGHQLMTHHAAWRTALNIVSQEKATKNAMNEDAHAQNPAQSHAQ